jgi:hypothetical protein
MKLRRVGDEGALHSASGPATVRIHRVVGWAAVIVATVALGACGDTTVGMTVRPSIWGRRRRRPRRRRRASCPPRASTPSCSTSRSSGPSSGTPTCDPTGPTPSRTPSPPASTLRLRTRRSGRNVGWVLLEGSDRRGRGYQSGRRRAGCGAGDLGVRQPRRPRQPVVLVPPRLGFLRA